MIEQLILDYLSENGIIAYPEEPKVKPSEYVEYDLQGHTKENGVYRVTIYMDIYSTSKYNASIFADRIERLMEDFISVDQIGKCEIDNKESNFDIVRKRYRYTADFIIYYTE